MDHYEKKNLNSINVKGLNKFLTNDYIYDNENEQMNFRTIPKYILYILLIVSMFGMRGYISIDRK